MSLREDYDLPPPSSGLPTLRMWAVMLAVPAAALILWLVLPDSVVTVAILVVAIIVAVGIGIFWVLSSRGMNRPLSRNPQPRH
jgi:Flp pilus assembly protein TadB